MTKDLAKIDRLRDAEQYLYGIVQAYYKVVAVRKELENETP